MGGANSGCACCASENAKPLGDEYWLTVGRRISPDVPREDAPPDFPDIPIGASMIMTESWSLHPMKRALSADGRLPHIPDFQEVEVPDWAMANWRSLGGEEVEEALESAAMTLVGAQWVIHRAKGEGKEGTLMPRQALPDESFMSLSQIQAASTNGYGYVLHIACVSHCWLQPDHPDPFGHNLRVLARCLKLLVKDAAFGGTWAVFFDFCSMHQACRDPKGKPQQILVYPWSYEEQRYESGAVGRFKSEEVIFDRALKHLGTFYSHPATVVFMLSTLPTDYADWHRYEQSVNQEPFMNRGWCYCEASWAKLVKEQSSVLDVGRQSGNASSWLVLVEECSSERRAPILPAAFKLELEHKRFLNSQEDFERVLQLYTAGFEERFATTTTLTYSGMHWNDADARALACLLEAGVAPRLCQVDLTENGISDSGAEDLARALLKGRAPEITSLNLSGNSIGDAGATALSSVLSSTAVNLVNLDLCRNSVGDEGAIALAGELEREVARKQVWLKDNPISKAARQRLGNQKRAGHSAAASLLAL